MKASDPSTRLTGLKRNWLIESEVWGQRLQYNMFMNGTTINSIIIIIIRIWGYHIRYFLYHLVSFIRKNLNLVQSKPKQCLKLQLCFLEGNFVVVIAFEITHRQHEMPMFNAHSQKVIECGTVDALKRKQICLRVFLSVVWHPWHDHSLSLVRNIYYERIHSMQTYAEVPADIEVSIRNSESLQYRPLVRWIFP